MQFKNEAVKLLLHDLIAPLSWLDQLEDKVLGQYCYDPSDPIEEELAIVIAGVELTLKHLQNSFLDEQTQVFPLLERTGENALLESLCQYRSEVSTLSEQLLNNLEALPNKMLDSLEYPWDNILLLTPKLYRQLIQYLHRVESDYLPMLDEMPLRINQNHPND